MYLIAIQLMFFKTNQLFIHPHLIEEVAKKITKVTPKNILEFNPAHATVVFAV